MAEYPTTKFDRTVDRVIAKENAAYLAALEKGGPGVCPNCLQAEGGWCWLCTAQDGSNARDPETWRAAQRTREEIAKTPVNHGGLGPRSTR